MTVVTHSIPSIMRSATDLLDYCVHRFLMFLSHDDTVIIYFYVIFHLFQLVVSSIIYFILSVLFSVEVVAVVEAVRKGLMTRGFIRIIIYGLSNINFYKVGLISSLLSIICCLILIHKSWARLSLFGNKFLQSLYKSSLAHRNMRSSLVTRYCFIPITHICRYGISLRLAAILLVILIISAALILYIFPPPWSQFMLSIVFNFLQFEFRVRFTSSLHNTMGIGLESSDSIDWSHLPLDLAPEIVNRMPTYEDYIAATGVSHIWRSARSSISRGPQLPVPALMLSEPLLTDMRTLFSLYDNSHHRLQLSEVRGKRIWGSQHGWVVSLGPRYVTQLVHLMTGKRIILPQVQRLAPREEWFCLVHKFHLLKDPTDESIFLVIAIFGPMNSLAFTRVRLETALNRRGEDEWVVVASPENLKFKDVAHFNDQIYALCDNGELVRFEADAPLADMVQVIADHPQDVGAHRKVYLVESLGNLYGVFRNGFLIPSERRFETTSFFVYKFNLNASAWEEVTHLEGRAFFVGDGNSFSWHFPTSTIPRRSNCIYFTWLFRTSTIPSRSNCIYFTDDQWDWQMYPSILAFGGHDVGVFDMASRDIQPLAFGIGKDKPCFYSRPIWVTRSHRLI